MPALTQFVLPKQAPAQPAGSLLYLQVTTDVSILRNRQVALLPHPATASPVELSASLGQGAILFLGQAVTNEAAFVVQLRRLLTTPSFSPVRLLWIANPNDRSDLWKMASLRSTGTTITAPSSVTLGSFGVAIESGCAITPRLNTPAFNIAPSGDAAAFFTALNGALRLPISGLSVSFDFQTAGALTFSLALEKGQIDQLDIGCRFYHPFAAFGPGTLASLRYPVFDRSSAKFSLDATMHPLAPLDPAATHFDFAADTPPISSYYRGATGIPVLLKPAAGARLVFAVRPTSIFPVAHDAFSLVPDGPFAIVNQDGTSARTLLCGIFGSEFIEMDGASSTLTFVAGQPAHAHAFEPGHDGPPPELSPEATTSWARLSGTGFRPRYSSVPEDAGFYRIVNSTSPLLEYYPATAAFLPSSDEAASSGSYPMPPYAGLDTGLADRQELEIHVLSRHRRERVRLVNLGGPGTQAPSNAADPSDITTLTPQGLLASFSADHAQWKTLRIAQSPNGSLALGGIQEPVRSALLTKQQFIVITDPSSIAGLFTQHTLDVSGWTFNLDPATWGQFGTIMILKNETGKLADLIALPAKWTLADHFNTSIGAAQDRLRQVLTDAKLALATNSNFDFFVKLVQDPDWNGVLFLRAPLSPGNLPRDLEGFAAGIDQSRFFAHHIGVNQTPVSEDDLKNQLHSSLFGLIDYNDLPGAGSPFAPFDFRVKQLRVLFKNSAVTDFSCRVGLTMNELFGAPVQVTGQTIELDGVYERHGDGNVLRLEGIGDTIFGLKDQVLEQVTVSKTHFSTRLPPQGDQGNVESRFTFFGNLKFRALAIDAGTPFDVFSYDTLAFSGLAVKMTFPQADPAQRSFELDVSEMVVTNAGATAREHSLAKHFPLKLERFMFSKEDSKPPAQIGYATVSIPLTHAKVASPWFGLAYDLNLGTLGALAASEGIIAKLILVWSPASAGSPPVLVGLKLPGLTGAGNQFTLFGVLKLKMHSLDLTVQTDTTGAVGYQLLLNGISLSLFGQAIPPGASFDFQVFGDSSSTAASDSLGWYGAFNP